MRRQIGYAVAWLAAVVVAVAVGIAAVSTVGATIRGRGPLGDEVVRAQSLETAPEVRPGTPRVRDEVTGEWGRFVVECQGVVAFGLDTVPASGWQVISYEQGPDDDVDAVFARGDRSVDLEVFCNQGRPTVAEIENNTLPASERTSGSSASSSSPSSSSSSSSDRDDSD